MSKHQEHLSLKQRQTDPPTNTSYFIIKDIIKDIFEHKQLNIYSFFYNYTNAKCFGPI